MKAARRAAAAQIAASLYLQAIEWIPVPPWNDLSHGNGQARMDLALGVVGLLLAAGSWARSRLAMWAAVAGYGAWLILQIITWWPPYLTGASAQWKRVYARWFAANYRFLPAIGDNPIPDAAHTVLQLFLLGAVAATATALYQRADS